jgi:hypothetical protein
VNNFVWHVNTQVTQFRVDSSVAERDGQRKSENVARQRGKRFFPRTEMEVGSPLIVYIFFCGLDSFFES